MAHDQLDNARRVVQIGVGLSLKPDEYTLKNATIMLTKLLSSDQIKLNCERYSKQIDFSQAVERTCDIVEQELAKISV